LAQLFVTPGLVVFVHAGGSFAPVRTGPVADPALGMT
jgi:hypothetical protein